MAVTNLGSASVNNAATTVAATCANAVAAGALVTVFVYDANTSIAGNSVTDSKGNTYTLAASSSPTANFFVVVFYSVITTSLTTSDTITYHCGNRSCAKELSIVSALGYGSIDPATTNSAVNFSTAYSVTGAGAAAVVNELYLGFVVSLAATVSVATGWTTNPPINPTANFYAAWQVNTGKTALTFNGAVGSQWWAAIIVSFEPSLTTNFASLAATETRDIATFPVMDENLAALSVTEARDVAKFIFPNLGALAATEARDRAFFKTPGASGASAVRVALTGERSTPNLEGRL